MNEYGDSSKIPVCPLTTLTRDNDHTPSFPPETIRHLQRIPERAKGTEREHKLEDDMIQSNVA